MDTSRIVINTIDNSSTLIEESTTVTGFTVVRAPKGPKTPIKLAAGSVAKIKDIFGESSAEYPELFEVETFNKEYDLWVSAPYNEGEEGNEKTKVPVAYLTRNGVFASDKPIPYNESVEKLILGEIDESYDELADLEGITTFSTAPTLIMDTRYPHDIFNYDSKAEGDAGREIVNLTDDDLYPGYDVFKLEEEAVNSSYLVINTGLTVNQLTQKVGIYSVKDGVNFRIHGYSTKYLEDFNLKFSADDTNNGIIKCKNGTTIVGFTGTYTDTEAGRVYSKITDPAKQVVYLFIKGVNEGDVPTGDVITQSYIASYLDQEEERQVLLTYWKKAFSSVSEADKEIYGVIIPKYPSDRELTINFSQFNEITGYKKKSYASRNILKMKLYEDKAFHNSNHKIEVSGSIDSTATDASGYSIGFIKGNSTYANQELIFVYGRKVFEKGDEFNTILDGYPTIKLFGGKRDTELTEEFDSIDFHNIGWGKAYENEFSDVDIFFDSSLHNKESLTELKNNDIFFQMASSDMDSHKLAGYIFNYTPDSTPNDIKQQLTFGRNYWNICNIAVTDINNGDRIFSPMTGARALMQCRIIEHRWGGIAPMWENTGTPSMGGQLTMINPYRLKYKYSKSDMDAYDLYNYNPVISDRQYGIMVVGQKTCKDGDSTDWSYIGHASAFLNFLKVVRENVMIPQIGKANNPYYRTLRKEQTERYLEERTTGNNRIWAEGIVDTSTADGVNDVYALAARKFVENVSVRVDVFSEKVELNFTNEDQISSVNAAE